MIVVPFLMAVAGAVVMLFTNPKDLPSYLVGVGIALGLFAGVVAH